MVDVIIQKYKETDEIQVEQLIDLCQEEKYLLRLLKSESLKFGYTASVGDQIVGLLMAWHSDFHPYCTYFRLLTNPCFSGSKIEEELFAKLETKMLPFQTSIWETTVNLKQFYESNGFKEIRRTYISVLKVETVINQETMEDGLIKTLDEVLLNPTMKDKLLRFVKKTYEETHLDNPVAEKSLEEWENLMLDGAIVDGSFIFIDSEEHTIEAFSFLHQSDQPNTFELGWCGSKKLEMLKGLLVKQIHYAKEHKVQELHGEFDTTSPDAMFCLGVFAFEPSPTWITYQKAEEKQYDSI